MAYAYVCTVIRCIIVLNSCASDYVWLFGVCFLCILDRSQYFLIIFIVILFAVFFGGALNRVCSPMDEGGPILAHTGHGALFHSQYRRYEDTD